MNENVLVPDVEIEEHKLANIIVGIENKLCDIKCKQTKCCHNLINWENDTPCCNLKHLWITNEGKCGCFQEKSHYESLPLDYKNGAKL